MTTPVGQGDLQRRIARLSAEKREVLEKLLKEQGPDGGRAVIRPRRGSDPCPLSFAQQRLWFLDQLEPGNPAYNVQNSWRFEGELDLPVLERSLNEIVRRHEALRTAFPVVDGSPVQKIAPELIIRLPQLDLSGLPPAEAEAEARRVAAAEAIRPFDLSRGPLIRAQILRRGAADHTLLATIHHIVLDGWSLGVLCRELATLYGAFAQGRPSPLGELSLQYADFAQWQRDWLRGDALEAQLSYWRKRLAGPLPVPELPTDHPRPTRPTTRGGLVSATIEPNVVEAIRSLGRCEGSTTFMILLAAFQALLYRHTGEPDVVVGTPIANRTWAEIEGLIGFFLNTLVLRTELSGDPTFRQLLGRVREVALGAYAHQDIPFEMLLEELQPERDLHRSPLFQVFFNMVNLDVAAPAFPGLRVQTLGGVPETAKFDLALNAAEQKDVLTLTLNYSRDLFEPDTATDILDHLTTLLAAAVTDPDRRVDSLPMLTAAQRKDAVARAERSRPTSAFVTFEPDQLEQSIADRFADVVERHPQKLAVKTGTHAWTYDELDRAAQAIADGLGDAVREEGARVALLFDHGAPMVAAVLGALKAGHTYVPLDPSHPAERQARILDHAQARAIVCDRANRDRAAVLADGERHLVDGEGVAPSSPPARPRPRVSPDNLAYLLYTSGSTGEPKAVMQSHRNVLGHIRNYTNALHIAANDGVTLLASYAFDAAVMDIFGALLNGATLHPIDVRTDGLDGLRRALQREEITIYHSTPSLYRALLGTLSEEETFARPRLVVLGGEEVHRKDLEPFAKHFGPHCLFVNGLGPTESTVGLQHFLDRDARLRGARVPVGHPVEGVEVWLLGEGGRRSTVRGEIALRSAYIALGYWQNPELTAAAFLPDPDGGNRRIYRTGDLGRMRPDGTLEFIGRKDRQVKLRGIRIELGEIERALTRHPCVREAVVVRREDGSGEGRLVAYVTTRPRSPSAGDLRAFVGERLPAYMVPAAFVTLEELPLTPNGKVDHRALPEPVRSEAEYTGDPRTGVEEVLAGMWAELLGRERVGIHDDFFSLGGHSLLGTQLMSRVREAFAVQVPLRLLFERPTVAGLAAALSEDPERRSMLEDTALELLRIVEMSDEEVDRSLSDNAPDPVREVK
jgi:amino acid adenylation domain-containing protein